MKTPKLILIIAALAAFTFTAPAQQADVYTMWALQGGNSVIPALSTNTVTGYSGTNTYAYPVSITNGMIQSIGEFNSVGFTFAFTGTATSTNTLLIFVSYDFGNTFGASPAYQFLNIAPGAASWITNGCMTNLAGATTLAVVVENTGTSYATNCLLEFNLKSPKFGAYPSTR